MAMNNAALNSLVHLTAATITPAVEGGQSVYSVLSSLRGILDARVGVDVGGVVLAAALVQFELSRRAAGLPPVGGKVGMLADAAGKIDGAAVD